MGTRDEAWQASSGRSRTGSAARTPAPTAFVPPPADEVPVLLEDLAASSGDDHPLLQAALAHSQFETIHPFADGNGRTGRALIQLVLRRRGVATVGCLQPVSLALATQTNRYIDALTATRSVEASQEGLVQWVDLFVDATARACRDSAAFGHDLAELEATNRAKVGRVRSGSAADLLVAAIPALPVFTVKTAADVIGRSEVAVGQAVTRLLKAGVIRQVKVGRRNRVFEATGLFEAFTGFEWQLASPDSDTAQHLPRSPVPARPGA